MSYTTGEVVGMTRIPLKTIQRYIKLFPDGFSKTACQSSRGRRYTAQDVRTLLLIRHLFGQKHRSEKIRQAITGEWTPEDVPWFDIENMMTIAQYARREFAEAGKSAHRAKRFAELSQREVGYLYLRISQLENAIKKLNNRLLRLEAKRALE